MNTLHRDMCNALSETSLSMPDRIIAVDAILDRFEVTPKPPITDETLGKMCKEACGLTGVDADYVGMRLAERLADAGLVIVRDEE